MNCGVVLVMAAGADRAGGEYRLSGDPSRHVTDLDCQIRRWRAISGKPQVYLVEAAGETRRKALSVARRLVRGGCGVVVCGLLLIERPGRGRGGRPEKERRGHSAVRTTGTLRITFPSIEPRRARRGYSADGYRVK